jgi:hypothetical protein
MRAAAKELCEMISSRVSSEEEPMKEYQETRRAAREGSGMPGKALVGVRAWRRRKFWAPLPLTHVRGSDARTLRMSGGENVK